MPGFSVRRKSSDSGPSRMLARSRLELAIERDLLVLRLGQQLGRQVAVRLRGHSVRIVFQHRHPLHGRLAEWIMSRPQIQEEAITQMAELLIDKVRPDGLAVVMEADHFCMHWRGVRDNQTKMINSVMRGSFLKDPSLRREFLSLLNLKD